MRHGVTPSTTPLISTVAPVGQLVMLSDSAQLRGASHSTAARPHKPARNQVFIECLGSRKVHARCHPSIERSIRTTTHTENRKCSRQCKQALCSCRVDSYVYAPQKPKLSQEPPHLSCRAANARFDAPAALTSGKVEASTLDFFGKSVNSNWRTNGDPCKKLSRSDRNVWSLAAALGAHQFGAASGRSHAYNR